MPCRRLDALPAGIEEKDGEFDSNAMAVRRLCLARLPMPWYLLKNSLPLSGLTAAKPCFMSPWG
jgi:hypothetical protein